MSFQKGNILLITFLVISVVFFIIGFGYFYLQKFISQKNSITVVPSVSPTPATAQITCKDDDFYAQQAMSLTYKVQDSFVTVSGCLAGNPGSPCQEKTLNLTPNKSFYLSSGKEQSVKVTLQKIENNKAYFLFEYGAAPPACETLSGCDYTCEFVKE